MSREKTSDRHKRKKIELRRYLPFASPPLRTATKQELQARRALRSKNQRNNYSLQRNLAISFLAFCYRRIAELFYHSYRISSFYVHPEASSLIKDPEGKFIIAFWHNRLFYLPYSVKQNVMKRGHDILAMVSPSQDGELTTRVLTGWGIYASRGSSSRKGTQALREILSHVRLRFQPAIIPDGPRGPRYKVKKGIALLARASALPVLPVSYAAKKAWRLRKSWDAFTIPKPFSPIALEYGAPISIPKTMSIEEGQRLIESKMQEQMRRMQAKFA